MADSRATVAVVMGVSGSGKTTVAALVAATQGWDFIEGDDLHSEANIAKMRAGLPLTDQDRWPWLSAIAAAIDEWRHAGRSGVLTCSALKAAYRQRIIGERRDVALVYLRGAKTLIGARLAARHQHYMPAALLESQFATLEEPSEAEQPIIIAIEGSPIEQASAVIAAISQRNQTGTGSAI